MLLYPNSAPQRSALLAPLLPLLALASGIVSFTGCWQGTETDVVVYTALDREFAEPIFEQFTSQTGIRVRALYDTEANKTVGLTNRIIAERERPVCDVFWNNEILNTLHLQRLGLLTPYRSPVAPELQSPFWSPEAHWHAFAARARILLVNTEQLQRQQYPTSIRQLADPAWKGRVGIAKPLFGTTRTHIACLFAYWGADDARQFVRQLKQTARILPGNRQVAQAVAAGQLAFGLTDTDDAMIAIEQGMPVAIVYPDQGADEMGTLFIPNSVALIRPGDPSHAGQQLIDYLLTAETERRLAQGRSAQIPLHPDARGAARIKTPAEAKAMQVDFARAAEVWDDVSQFLEQEFAAAD